MPTTISLLNMKGGVGKTTLAVNLAWYMHEQQNMNVLLVDLDPQFNATQYIMNFESFSEHRKANGTIADLLLESPSMTISRKKEPPKKPSKALYNVRHHAGKRFDLLPAELNLAWVVKNPAQMESKLEKLLEQIRGRYDYVFIDCAPTDSVLTTMALGASNYLLVPVRPDHFSLLGYGNLLNTVDQFKKNCHDPHSVTDLGVIFTQVRNSGEVEAECIEKIEELATEGDGYVFKAKFRYSQSFARALKDKTPIFRTSYANDQIRKSIKGIATELEERLADIT